MYFIKLISFAFVFHIIYEKCACQQPTVLLLTNISGDEPDTDTELTTDDDMKAEDDLITVDDVIVGEMTTESPVTTTEVPETTVKTTPQPKLVTTTSRPTTTNKPAPNKVTQTTSIKPTTTLPRIEFNENPFLSCIESDCQYEYSPVCTVTDSGIKVTLINFCMIHISNCLANKTIYTYVQNGTCPRSQ